MGKHNHRKYRTKKTKNIIVDTTNTIFQYISEPDDRDINDYTAISKLIKTPSIVYADKKYNNTEHNRKLYR